MIVWFRNFFDFLYYNLDYYKIFELYYFIFYIKYNYINIIKIISKFFKSYIYIYLIINNNKSYNLIKFYFYISFISYFNIKKLFFHTILWNICDLYFKNK